MSADKFALELSIILSAVFIKSMLLLSLFQRWHREGWRDQSHLFVLLFQNAYRFYCWNHKQGQEKKLPGFVPKRAMMNEL